ncbi:MAG: trypsin-like peptidase domain-containing protein [Cyanobacteria bacterium SZAS LIN-3]|nr:trypsin-like peptidase domain-containing protein [Cyanobacteria bacterium SZAS LIN-3]
MYKSQSRYLYRCGRSRRGGVQTGSLVLGVLIGLVIAAAFVLGKAIGLKDKDQPVSKTDPVAAISNPSPALPGGGVISSNTIGDIAEGASKWVVNIDTMKVVQISPWSFGFGDSFFGVPSFGPGLTQAYQSRGTGSGVIIKADGYILTNRHVVGDADEIKVTLSDKKVYDGRVVGRDAITDLALVKINAKDLPVAKLGTSKNLRPGDWAIAIGSPLGFDHSVTLGIISALDRSVDEVSQQMKLIQTDAAINPGNSGGPLLNIKGEVVGIITAISRQGQNIGFAIPSEVFEDVTRQLLAKGKVSRPYFGLHMADLTPALADELGVGADVKGVVVDKVYANSPAAASNIQVGDVITKLDDQEVSSARELGALARAHKIGDTITFMILRQGELVPVKLAIADRADG